MAAHLVPKDHRRRWGAATMLAGALVATIALVQLRRGSDPTVDTSSGPGSTSGVTVLGEVLTRSDLPEADAAVPITLDARALHSSASTVTAPPTTKPGRSRSTTSTVPDPVLIPPLTIENTTTTSSTTTTTTTEPTTTTTTTEPTTTTVAEPPP